MFRLTASTILALLLFVSFSMPIEASLTTGELVEVTLHARYSIISPGNYTKAAVTLHDPSLPYSSISVACGPTLRVKEGQTLSVRLVNHLSNEGITIHWHGIHMLHSPYMDGVGHVTQYPVGPGEEFVYQFLANKAGTYWYHSHIEPQRDDAAFGALIVEPPEDDKESLDYDKGSLDHDEEVILILSDFYAQEGNLQTLQLGAAPLQWVGDPDLLLVNGQDNYTLEVEEGKTYLVHLISAATISYYNVSWPRHNLTIVEVESSRVEPYATPNIWINAGERYSFLLTANSPGCYRGGLTSLNSPSSRGQLNLVYSSSCGEWIQSSAVLPFDGQKLRSRHNKTLPEATRNLTLTTRSLINSEGQWRYQFNDTTYQHHSVPLLLAYHYQILIPESPNVLTIHEGEVLDITFVNLDTKQHPIHLHGHSFWILTSDRPVKRDTFTLPAGESLTIRLVANNPGVWMVHCHVSWHVMMGMGLLLAYPPETIPPPPQGFPIKGVVMDKVMQELHRRLSYLEPLAFTTTTLLALVVVTAVAVLLRRLLSDGYENIREDRVRRQPEANDPLKDYSSKEDEVIYY